MTQMVATTGIPAVTTTRTPRRTATLRLPFWHLRALGLVRIAFGLVWAVDAGFKWVPSFVDNFSTYMSSDNQPRPVGAWINFWNDTINVDPHVFAHLVAVGETAVAIGLIFGLFSNATYAVGALLSAVIWSTAEGFGGPYTAGSTDIGAAIIYVFVFAALFLAGAGRFVGVDGWLGTKLGRFSFLASGGSTAPSSDATA